jgi:hypothetical protein
MKNFFVTTAILLASASAFAGGGVVGSDLQTAQAQAESSAPASDAKAASVFRSCVCNFEDHGWNAYTVTIQGMNFVTQKDGSVKIQNQNLTSMDDVTCNSEMAKNALAQLVASGVCPKN